MDEKNMISCPNCGGLNQDEIRVYNEGLRKQSFSLSPILPTCKRCGAEAALSHTCDGGSVIVLNGTCGSGKSTVAEILAGKGFLAIDGDCVMQTVRHKKNTKQVSFDEIAEEVGVEIDALSLFGNRFVVSCVIMPGDLEKYIKLFEARNLKYAFYLLKPEYQTAVERCQSRTCHTSVTPEFWIKHFYDQLNFDDRVVVVDNTNMTPEETAKRILEETEWMGQ